jgi:hypothetical protein
LSLEVIEPFAFALCGDLTRISFPRPSRLRCVGKSAFMRVPLETANLPATAAEIDPAAFEGEVWRILRFDGKRPFVIVGRFLCSADSKKLVKPVSEETRVVVTRNVETIGSAAFEFASMIASVRFENGTKLREIADRAFAGCVELRECDVPATVLTIGDECFWGCRQLARVAFENGSRLKRIGAGAFCECRLRSMGIPSATEEIDGSAFAKCPLLDLRVSPGNRHFRVDGNFLMTKDGREVVRYFGMECEVFVASSVEVLRKSSFESCDLLRSLIFEPESKLKTIGISALADCKSFLGISIPGSVEVIEDAALKGCAGLEYFHMNENAKLARIGNESFCKCRSLRSLEVASGIEGIGENCFRKCASLQLLKFQSPESLKKVFGQQTLDVALEHLGLAHISSLFKIDLGPVTMEMELDFPGWTSVVDENSHLTLIRYPR